MFALMDELTDAEAKRLRRAEYFREWKERRRAKARAADPANVLMRDVLRQWAEQA